MTITSAARTGRSASSPSKDGEAWESVALLAEEGVDLRDSQLSETPDGRLMLVTCTGRIRGMKYKRADGKTVRPSLVVLDDPQTDESARSPSQCAHRESILAGAVLGLAGPKRKIAGGNLFGMAHR